MFYIREKRQFHFLLPSLEPSQFSNPERCIVLPAQLIRDKAKRPGLLCRCCAERQYSRLGFMGQLCQALGSGDGLVPTDS